jgi:3-oxoacyl-[acyl-carrier protein] reductase
MKILRGKRALVTGAASGIGRAIACALAREGCDLWLWDIDEEGLQRVADEWGGHVEVVARRCDLSDMSELDAELRVLQDRWGCPEIVVNNAGLVYWGPTANMTDTNWDRLMTVNLLAPARIIRALLPRLLKLPEAHIVNVASLFGLVTTKRSTAYHASKFGLVGLTEALRTEYARHGLGVTAICPGFVDTNLFRNGISGRKDRDIPNPPRWIRTTSEKVAQRTIRAIRRDERMVVMTPLGHLLYRLKRFAPWLLDLASRWGRRKKIRARVARLQAAERKAAGAPADSASQARIPSTTSP